MNAKISLSSLLVPLVLGCCLELTSSGPLALESCTNCCLKTNNIRIPLNKVVSFYRTSSCCDVKAVVFVTQLGRKICINPSLTWVSSHVTHLENRSKTASTTISIAATSTMAASSGPSTHTDSVSPSSTTL